MGFSVPSRALLGARGRQRVAYVLALLCRKYSQIQVFLSVILFVIQKLIDHQSQNLTGYDAVVHQGQSSLGRSFITKRIFDLGQAAFLLLDMVHPHGVVRCDSDAVALIS